MKFAVGYFPTDRGIDPVTLARMVEERPFESLFFTDHTHIPASRETPYPAGTELPWEYSHIHDPFVALMAAGAATERISARIARLRKAGEESGRGPVPTTLANATTDPGVLELDTSQL